MSCTSKKYAKRCSFAHRIVFTNACECFGSEIIAKCLVLFWRQPIDKRKHSVRQWWQFWWSVWPHGWPSFLTLTQMKLNQISENYTTGSVILAHLLSALCYMLYFLLLFCWCHIPIPPANRFCLLSFFKVMKRINDFMTISLNKQKVIIILMWNKYYLLYNT